MRQKEIWVRRERMGGRGLEERGAGEAVWKWRKTKHRTNAMSRWLQVWSSSIEGNRAVLDDILDDESRKSEMSSQPGRPNTGVVASD
jgi:hypothetical protein